MPRYRHPCPKTFWRQEAKATFAMFLDNPSKITLSVVVIDCCRYLFAIDEEKYPAALRRSNFESFIKAISYVINSFE